MNLVLKLAAICLHYPDPGFLDNLLAVERALPKVPKPARDDLRAFCREARRLEPIEWERRYVQAFDFNKKAALYLVYHELGDSIERSAPLIALKQQIRAAGFECPDDELPDYIPLLLEFLAEEPANGTEHDLPQRLATVLPLIVATLEESDPLYVPVFRAALSALPAATEQSSGVMT